MTRWLAWSCVLLGVIIVALSAAGYALQWGESFVQIGVMTAARLERAGEAVVWSIAFAIGAVIALLGGAWVAQLDGTLRLARKSFRQHALSTGVTVLSVALAVGLLMAVFAIKAQTYAAFTAASGGFDAVVGERGSKLQLVLNSVYHLETSPGNIPYTYYQHVARQRVVKLAIPYAVGDNYKGFRLVGTDVRLFTEHEMRTGERIALRGRVFDPTRREAVLGSFAARQTGLDVGDRFNSYHGLVYSEQTAAGAKHPDEFLVVGVMEPTNTPLDRVIWIPLEAYFRMSGHSLQGAGERFIPEADEIIPDEHKEVSAVMLTLRGPPFQLDELINDRGTEATFAWPIATIMADLFEKVGWVNRVLELVAYLVVVVAAGSILASIYNTMNERRREFAILRALGARRGVVCGAIVTESTAIALLGAAVGFAVYAALLTAAAAIVRAKTGVVLEVWAYHPIHALTPAAMVALGAIAGLVPAAKAYNTDVATNLIPAT